ncbi:DUF362 domain-containing protein [Petroclostridium sp. X23]|uniref:DUF362 domain-containing protein n=1 Tax=Petroclostridium sp. X23 TaxID=3045146 RepID=UPI0024AD7AAF|nr:DUF362 domain-containing protein [Petroclostridium sp. X23]WHH57913.1 DUF362 domain-containing protein [Petroclostridium sp. X23]
MISMLKEMAILDKVYITKCPDYEYEHVKAAVTECFERINGMKEQMKPGAKVLIKVNLLKKNKPEDAVTTHPSVIQAMVEYLQNQGCIVVLGDSPGGPFTERMLRSVYTASGMVEVAEKTGCMLNYDTSVVEVSNDKALRLKNMQVIKILEEVDFVISAAKLKTHGMMTFTGAVKNLFGVIPGLTKADYHLKMSSVDNFSEHLIDICEYVCPVFSIIDGIEGMEGDGPAAGDKRQVGLIMASANPYALDVAAAYIVGINPQSVPTIRMAEKRGLCKGSVNDYAIEGIKIEELKISPFKLPKSISINFVGGRVPKFIEDWVMGTLRPKPVFDYALCISCGDCHRSCPPKVIDMSSGKPVVDLNKCIRCFCCHELCPKKAVDIKKHWLYEKVFK